MNAYCLFCNTARRDQVAGDVRRLMGAEALVPKILRRKWIRGEVCDTTEDYLPGYLFIYSDAPLEDFSPLFRMADVYRVLGARELGYRLTGQDLAFAEMLRGVGGTIGALKACQVGDRVALAEGALGGVSGEIIRLDRRGRALVRFGFDGAPVQSWVAIERIDNP